MGDRLLATRMLLDRADQALSRTALQIPPAERYVVAHLAATRTAAAVLSYRGRATTRGGPRSVWDILPDVAPELADWATRFIEAAPLRHAIESGVANVGVAHPVDDAIADALVADARQFFTMVREAMPTGDTDAMTFPEATPDGG